MKTAEYIDHTFLKPAGEKDAVWKLCREAKKAGFASVCVNPCEVKLAAKLLKGSRVKVCTVIGFPLGANTTEVKLFEALEALRAGATELDFVVNQRLLKYEPKACEKELRVLADACKSGRKGVALKLILECCNLTKEEIVRGCKLAKKAGFDFVKTSTGFAADGATVEDVKLMRKTVGKKMGVKAAGGIRDRETALKMIAAGATRIGTSAGLAILKGTAACLLAGLALLGGEAFAAEPVNTVMPYSLGACGGEPAAIAERLRTIRDRSGISRFVMSGPGHVVRVTGMLDEAGYAAIGRKLRAVADLAAADGIEVGYLMMPTMNCGINHPWRQYVRKDGKVRAFTPCPADEGFRRAFAAKCAAVAREAQPFLYMMEDDFRYFFDGCYCEEHRRRLAAGEERHEMYMKDLRAIAAAASKAILEVSPKTRVGLCAPGGFPLESTDELARILAGPNHRPYVRYYGAIYGNDRPIDLAGLLCAAQMARETLPPDVEYVYESDPVPHSRFYASAARVGALVSWTSAMGYDGAYYWGLGSSPEALATSPDYLDLHKRDYPRWAAIRAEAKKGSSVGVSTGCSAWTWVLNRMGIPTVMRPSEVRLLSSPESFAGWTSQMVTNALSQGVFLDGPAAEELTRRGFADLIGIRAQKRESVDFSGEQSADGTVRYPCSFHQNYGLDGVAVSRFESVGAEALAYFFAGYPTNRVQPSVTFFTNKLGGRVAALAVDLANCVSPNVFSFSKRDLIVSTIGRLGGPSAVPARAVDRVNVALLANEDAGKSRLFLHLVNLSCDPFGSVELEVGAPYAGGTVDVLDGANWRPLPVVWRNGRMTVPADVAVYGTLALRLVP